MFGQLKSLGGNDWYLDLDGVEYKGCFRPSEDGCCIWTTIKISGVAIVSTFEYLTKPEHYTRINYYPPNAVFTHAH